MSDHIRFSPEILSRLGEELIPNPEQGILELVKNSYDADATECVVTLIPNSTGETIEIQISDNGNGMDKKTIQDGWLILGKSAKSTERQARGRFARSPVGDKGLGRLSALRQGEEVLLLTRPKSEPGWEYSVRIFWKLFDSVRVVEDVDIDIKRTPTKQNNGTEIHIKGLKNKFKKGDIERLARDLVLLSEPFASQNEYGFRVELKAAGFADLEKIVKDGYFEDAEYHLIASLSNGQANAKVVDWKGEILYKAEHEKIVKATARKKKDDVREIYNSPDAVFDLWVYLLGKTSFSSRRNPITKVREWLSFVGGIHIYHRGVRVKPYGDPGNDWLDMNLKRTRSPEERPSTNNSIGLVTISDPNDLLVPKTDRMGFIENDMYYELKQFCEDCLDWMAKERLTIAEQRRKLEREQKPKAIIDARKKLDKIIETHVPADAREDTKKAINVLQDILDKELKDIKDDLQLYRSLATAGILVVKFAHQTNQPISNLTRTTKYIEVIQNEIPNNTEVNSRLSKAVDLLHRSVKTLQDYSVIPIKLLRHEKRRNGVVYVHDVLINIIQTLTPFTEKAHIKVETYFEEEIVCINGSEALLEAILTNFFTNSITALTEPSKIHSSERKICIYTLYSENKVTLKFADNGPGISIDMDEIWLPGRTTTENGTGFGLTIVRDSVTDLSGKVYAISNGELGGAEFVVELPAFINKQGRLFNV